MQFSHGFACLRRTSALVLALGLAACAQQPIAPQASAHPPVMTQALQKQMTADQALQLLKDGNARFAAGKPLHYDLPMQIKTTGNGQYPFASVVSCIDSRSSPSQVFDMGVGDAFEMRVAGNVVSPDILGSLEYGAKVAAPS